MAHPDGRPSTADILHSSQAVARRERPLAPIVRGTVSGAIDDRRKPSNNLILPRTPLIGREAEVATVQSILLREDVGLLTLTGPGGIGKTRLALQVAADLLDHFVDGVYVVLLAPISDPGLVSATIAQAIGVRESETHSLLESVQAFLRDRQLLLVLDNFEQVAAAATVVSGLLAACHRLKVLATSRASLHLYGEYEVVVAPLALPTPSDLTRSNPDSVASLVQIAAVKLFYQRAAAVRYDFVLTASNVQTVAEICIGLDGLPLAIELAAARLKIFSLSDLLASLDQRLALLIGGPQDAPLRQRTLRDEIAWSYNLLTPGEQMLFRRLAVFVGGFTLEAAHAVANAEHDLGVDFLDGFTTLLDQNLVRHLELSGGESRFGLLETIREYALEQLAASGEVERLRRHHANFYLALAEAIETDLTSPQPQCDRGRAHLRTELDNLRAVFSWSIHNQWIPATHTGVQLLSPHEVGLRLAAALSFFPFGDDHTHELRHWLETTLQWEEASTATRAKVLWGAGITAIIHGDYRIAHIELEESVALCRRLDEPILLAAALRELCLVATIQGDFTAAQRYGEESVALYRSLGRQPDLAIALENLGSTFAHQRNLTAAHLLFEEQLALARRLDGASQSSGALVGLGWVARLQGDYATARAYFTEALAIRRKLKENWMIAEALDLLGEVVQQQGAREEAGHHYREGLIIAYEVGDKGGMAQIFYHLSTLALDERQPTRATCLLAFATVLCKTAGGLVYHAPTAPADWEQTGATLQTALSVKQFAQCWAEGQAMLLQEAITYALMMDNELEHTSASSLSTVVTPSSNISQTGLTTREVEVLRLLVQGLTYAQIADTLVVSRRTVNAHATSIYSKLGVTSRAQATRLAIEQRLA
jgi:predicted ATPase/DNA-binding CsgD family transcriptional regulator